MATVWHTATVVASHLSMVEGNSESENDDGLLDDNDNGGNEAGSKVEAIEEATEGNERVPRHVQDDRIDR